ncbi:DUF5683 domain-containing protein [Hymenobacter sp. B81]|uniref:DUF5683 domain-containing protein n=1 Tax=Hymenobacter sp. B81 TaxID=3344878 RepID=UPI0037DD369F
MNNPRFPSLVTRLKVAPLLLAVGLLLFPAPAARAQTVTTGPDSAQVAAPAVPDSLRRTERLLGLRMTRPTKAAVLSLVLPGAGQVYNRKYWKLPLVYAGLGGTVYGELFYWRRYQEFKAGYDIRRRRQAAEQAVPVNPELVRSLADPGARSGLYSNTATGDASQQRVFNAYRSQRDVFFAYIALAYGLQVLDALVDAHLHDFDISEDLSLRCQPTLLLPPGSPLPATGVAFTFTLNPPPAARR